MNNERSLVLFEKHKIRRDYDEKTETWYFSVVDIIAALIQQPDYQAARKHWNKLKERPKKEGGTRGPPEKAVAVFSSKKNEAPAKAEAQLLLHMVNELITVKRSVIHYAIKTFIFSNLSAISNLYKPYPIRSLLQKSKPTRLYLKSPSCASPGSL